MRTREGADWVVRMHSGRFGWLERRAVRRWLAASAEHARDLLRAETVWRLSGSLAQDSAVRQELDGIRRPAKSSAESLQFRRWSMAAVTTLLLVVAGAWLARSQVGERYETTTGEQRMVTLSDGSTVAINTASRLVVEFSELERRIVLVRGEALFQAAHDAARPFIVRAGDGSVRAVGTRFNVLVEDRAVTVSVLEGRVDVTPVAGETRVVRSVAAGDSTAYGHGRLLVASPERASRERIAAWREGKLRFDDWPLQRAIEEHNRYAKRPIRLDASVAGETVVSGVFRIGDTEALIEALRKLMEIEAIDGGDAWVLMRRLPPQPASPSVD